MLDSTISFNDSTSSIRFMILFLNLPARSHVVAQSCFCRTIIVLLERFYFTNQLTNLLISFFKSTLVYWITVDRGEEIYVRGINDLIKVYSLFYLTIFDFIRLVRFFTLFVLSSFYETRCHFGSFDMFFLNVLSVCFSLLFSFHFQYSSNN